MKGSKRTAVHGNRNTRVGGSRSRAALVRTALAVAIGMGLPALVQARVQPSAHDGHEPTVLQAANGTPVVNIVAPGKHGVSHNTYTQFDVGTQGLILNNSAAISNTQLAGYVYGNANLEGSGPARIILNEVTSTRRSQLDGYMEVAGTPAEVIVANPNGIACDGCGFINTPRAVLTTGTPVIGGDGRLSGFRVTRGTINIRGAGLDASHIDRVDLLARAIRLNAKLWAQHVNVVAGANRIAHADLSATPIAGEGDAPLVGIDVAALGGMYSGVIRLVGTEAGVGVNSQGEIAAQAGDFTLTSAGEVVLDGNTTATGRVTVSAPQSVQVDGVLAAGDTLTVQGGDLDLGGTVYSATAMRLDAAGKLVTRGQVQAYDGNLDIRAGDAATNVASGALYAGNAIHIDAGRFANAGTVEASGDLRLAVSDDIGNSGILQADSGKLLLSARSMDNAGTLAAGAQLGVTTIATLANTGTITADGKITLDAGGFVNAGAVQSATALSIGARHDIHNNGKLYALGDDWTATAGGGFVNGEDGDIYGGGDVTLAAGDTRNDGRLEAAGNLSLDIAGTLDNRATLQSDAGDVGITATRMDNRGTLSANGDLAAAAATTFDNSGTLVAARAVSLSANALANAGQVQAGTDLAVQATTLHNSGTLHAKRNAAIDGTDFDNATASAQLLAGQTLTLDSTGRISNAGVLQAAGDLLLTHATALDNRAGALVYAGRDLDVTLTGMLTNAGTLRATHTQTLSVASLDNSGTLSSAGNLQLDSAGDAISSGAIEAQQGVTVSVGGDLTHAGKLYAIDGDLVLHVDGALAAQTGSDIYSGADMAVTAAGIAQAGTLEADGDVTIGSDGALDNRGAIQADNGKLGLTAQSISNTGALSAATSATLNGAQSLDNRGNVVSGGAMALDSAQFANRGQIQSGGDLTVQAAHIDNRASIQSAQALYITGNQDLANADGSQWLAAGDLQLDSDGRIDNAGVMQAGGALAVTAAAVDNTAAGIFYGSRPAVFNIAGELDNAGTLYGGQGLDLTAATVHNDGVLRSGTGIGISVHGDAWNTGTAYAVGDAYWRIDGALDNTGVLAAGGDTSVHAGSVHGDGTLAAGLQGDGALSAHGTLEVTAQHALQAGGRNLAGGDLIFAGDSQDLAGSHTRAGGDITVSATAGDILHGGAQLVAGGTAALNASGTLHNGGAHTGDGGSISATMLKLAVASIDNRHGSLLQRGAGDLAIHIAGAFDNAYGVLATNAGNLDIQVTALDNRHGSIQHAGNGTLALKTAGAFDNEAGAVASNGNLQADIHGDLDNHDGVFSIQGDAALVAESVDNTDGSVIADQLALTATRAIANAGGILQSAAGLSLSADTLDNGGGQIKATGSDTLRVVTTGMLGNASDGFIGGNGDVRLQAGSLANAGQIYAGTALDARTTHGTLDNSGGTLQTLGSLALHSATALANRAGRIEAGAGSADATLDISADSIDNRDGRLANAGQGDSTVTVADGIDNRGGTLGGQGDVRIDSTGLDNGDVGKLVAGRDLLLQLGGLDNAGGTVYAARNLAWSRRSAHLENGDGSIGAGGNLSLTAGAVDNTDGDIAADNDVTLDLTGLTGTGRVVAGRDLSLTLPDDYASRAGATLKANRDFRLDLGGDFSNVADATLEAVRALSIHAHAIDNAAGAVLNSTDTTLDADTRLSNEGRIEGDRIELAARSIVNTGDIIGGSIIAHAGDLTNGADLGQATDNPAYQSALIAATESIDLYVTGTLLNRDAAVFTLGDLTLAADAGGHRSDAIINRSGDIEADGDIVLAARQITNERRIVEFHTYPVSGNTIEDGSGGTAGTVAMRTGGGVHAMLVPVEPPGDGGDGGTGTPPNTRQDTTWYQPGTDPDSAYYCAHESSDRVRCTDGAPVRQVDTWTVTSATILAAASAESRILAGQDMSLSGSVRNDASTMAVGHDLVINQFDQRGEVGTGDIGGETVQNIARTPTVGMNHHQVKTIAQEHESHCGFGGFDWCWDPTDDGVISDITDTTPPADGDNSFVTLDLGPSLSAHITAGNTVSIHAQTIDNTVVDADGNPVHGAIGLGANGGVQSVAGTAGQVVAPVTGGEGDGTSVALGHAPDAQHGDDLGVAKGGPRPNGSAGPQAVSSTDTAPMAPQSLATLTGPDATLSLPQSGLYTIDRNPDSSYLVETDPRFADYSQFISSDYLLDKLGYDPAQTAKRLGDGFYEQRQVLDQITSLTGRRFLSDDTDALAQYRELMNNAATLADRFDLSLGVALTAEQMAGLTRDIVWLVEQTVGGQQVLVPVVYLSPAHARQLARQGAVIAGKNVILDSSGQLTNNGSIVASHDASLKAGNLLNSGTLAAGDSLSIQTAHDLLNQGGVIRGVDVSLVAGGNLVSSAAIGPVALGGVDLGALDTGGIHAVHTLSVQAGRNLSLDQVHLSAGQDLAVAAGRDLEVNASTITGGNRVSVLAARDLSLGATTHTITSYDGHTFSARTTHDVSTIKGGGRVAIAAGRDLNAAGAQFEAGGKLAVAAGRDLNLDAVTDTAHSSTQWSHGHTWGNTRTSDDTVRGATLNGTDGVSLSAGRDATLTAATVDSGNGAVTLAAGRDVHLGAAVENHTWAEDSHSHHSGLLSSSSTTTHDATQDGIAVGTALSGDSVRIVAGHDLTTQGAQVSAAQDIALAAGHDIDLGAAYDTHSEQHQRKTEKRGGGLGVLIGTSKSDLLTHRHKSQTDASTDTSAYGTLLSGDTVRIAAGHDLTTEAAQVAATHDIVMAAGHDLVVDAAANTHSESHGLTTRVTGGQRNGLHAMVGVTETGQKASETDTTYTGSLIGSTSGSVAMTAGHDVHITGSDILSQTGTAIVGQNVTIDAALGHADSHQQHSMHSAGIMGGLTGGAASAAEGAYAAAKRGGRAKDKRLKALYAARAAYQSYEATEGVVNGMAGAQGQAVRGNVARDAQGQVVTGSKGKPVAADSGAQGAANASGVSLHIAIGASTANGHADTHDDIAYGSHIRSQGDVAIAATHGDLNIIGSEVSGRNVALSASHDLNLLSQAEQHTQKQSNANAGGQIGVSLGSTTGIYLSVEGGKSRVHGNGTTHLDSSVTATDTLSLTAGHDATIKGAQARGQTVLANIGHDLTLASEQDTDDYASNYWQGGLTLVYGFSNTGVGVSGHLSLGQTDSTYRSVTQVSGLAAGDGGFQLHVGGNTELKGAVIASTADPALNYLDTRSLAYGDIDNSAEGDVFSGSFSADSSMFSGSKYGAAEGIARNVLGNSSDGERHSSVTRSGISDGLVTIRDGRSEVLDGLNRDVVGLSAKEAIGPIDTEQLEKNVEASQIIKGIVYQESLKFTDEAYRTMFLKKANVYEVVHDKNGKLAPGRLLTDEEKMNMQPAPDGKIHIADNGIFNDEEAAEKYANQHSTADDGPQYYIDFPEASNGMSELLVAGYQEFLESDYWGLANATRETKTAMKRYGQQGLQLDAHSRGTLTVGNAMESLVNESGSKGALTDTTISFFGPAYNAKNADSLLSYLQNREVVGDPEQRKSMALTTQNHVADPVGRVIGRNPPTGGTIPEGSSWIKEMLRAIGGKNTSHNCYGSHSNAACKKMWQDYPDGRPDSLPVAKDRIR